MLCPTQHHQTRLLCSHPQTRLQMLHQRKGRLRRRARVLHQGSTLHAQCSLRQQPPASSLWPSPRGLTERQLKQS